MVEYDNAYRGTTKLTNCLYVKLSSPWFENVTALIHAGIMHFARFNHSIRIVLWQLYGAPTYYHATRVQAFIIIIVQRIAGTLHCHYPVGT